MTKPCSKLTTTLVIPTLNELQGAIVIMPQIKKEWIDQILIVDGGSTDGTIEYFQTHGYELFIQINKGYGEAIKEALLQAKGDIIIEFTPDGNSLPEAIPQLIQKIHEGYDLVVASRYKDNAKSFDDDWLTAFGNWMFTRIVNVLFRCHITDALVAYRAYRKETALQLDLDEFGLAWPCQNSLRFIWRGFNVTEIPVNEPARIGGTRKMKPFKTGMEIIKLILKEFFLSKQKSHAWPK